MLSGELSGTGIKITPGTPLDTPLQKVYFLARFQSFLIFAGAKSGQSKEMKLFWIDVLTDLVVVYSIVLVT